MGRSVHSCRELGGVLLAATTVIGLTIGTILAQGNPSGSAESTQEEPIKRAVLFRGDLEGAPGKEIVVFVADLAPGAVGAKHSLGIRSAQEMEPIRPINLVSFIANVNAGPSITHEIGRLEDGSCRGIPSEFRMAATPRMFTVDRKWHWTGFSRI